MLARPRVTTGLLETGERHRSQGIYQLYPLWLLLPEGVFGCFWNPLQSMSIAGKKLNLPDAMQQEHIC